MDTNSRCKQYGNDSDDGNDGSDSDSSNDSDDGSDSDSIAGTINSTPSEAS